MDVVSVVRRKNNLVEIFVHTPSNPAAGANLVLWRLLMLAVLLHLWRSIVHISILHALMQKHTKVHNYIYVKFEVKE